MEKLDVDKMTKGVIYYTDNRIDGTDILRNCQEQLRKSFGGEIINVSLKPSNFGTKNIVLEGRTRSYPTQITQILTALEASSADVVFFCEHDVLYHPSHFDITPEKSDTYYYNCNNWRWRFPTDFAITYNYLTSLSMMCCNRWLGIDHYKRRIEQAKKLNLDEHRAREPRWARLWGYEPGTKRSARGGFSDEPHINWYSDFPSIDIRHNRTFSKPKTTLGEFKHPPLDSWKEININEIEGWELRKIFNL